MSSESAARCHVSLSDVSQAAHISIATASRAFVHPERVNADTLKRIYDAAEKSDMSRARMLSSRMMIPVN